MSVRAISQANDTDKNHRRNQPHTDSRKLIHDGIDRAKALNHIAKLKNSNAHG